MSDAKPDRKKSPKEKAEDFVNGVVGLLMLAAIGWGVWTFVLKGDDAQAALDPALALGDYAALTGAERAVRIASTVAGVGAPDADIPAFTRCMGWMAVTKSDQLAFDEVFGWCDKERHDDRTAFDGHFDQLAAADLSTEAAIICTNFVRGKLLSPATANFPLLDHDVSNLRRHKYFVGSYVDSQNVFGAVVRTRYSCSIEYAGAGDPLSPASWSVAEIELFG